MNLPWASTSADFPASVPPTGCPLEVDAAVVFDEVLEAELVEVLVEAELRSGPAPSFVPLPLKAEKAGAAWA